MDPPVRVDAGRIQAMLDELHRIGARPSGGVWRGVYSPAWREAQALIGRWMEDAGLDTRVDAVGSVWGYLHASEPGPPIASGSHFDSVPDGGKFDGPLGVVGAIVALATLREQFGRPRRSLAALATCEEEGSRFGDFWASRAILGQIAPDEPYRHRDADGTLMADEMRASGLDPNRVGEARTSLAAFLELHIEQGPVLEEIQRRRSAGEPRVVGAVTAITGTSRLRATLVGRPDHSGTTPMLGRRDALLGLAEVALALREQAIGAGPTAKLTIGRVELSPNAGNVVPERAQFSIDVRSPDRNVQVHLMESAAERCRQAARTRDLECTVETTFDQPPTTMAPDLVEQVRQAARRLGYAPIDIVSGAGHDAQVLGRHVPAAMVFAVTRGGRSHCPDEAATAEDCAAGVATLAETLRALAY